MGIKGHLSSYDDSSASRVMVMRPLLRFAGYPHSGIAPCDYARVIPMSMGFFIALLYRVG